MSARDRWRRVDAEHWVHVFGVVLTTVLFLGTFVVLFVAWLLGPLWFVVLPACATALAGWVTGAWHEEKPWAWLAWVVLCAVVLLLSLGRLLDTGPTWGSVYGLVSGGVLVLLLHPDCRARLDAFGASPSSGRSAGARTGRSSAPSGS